MDERLTGLEAIAFDLDGTLADTFDLLVASFAAALEPEIGRVLSRSEVVRMFGPGAGTEEHILSHFAGRLSPELIARFHRFYADLHPSMSVLYPGVRESLDCCCEKGILLAVMTGKGSVTTEITLRHLGIKGCFDVVITGEEAVRPKPDPMGVHLILRRLGLPACRMLLVGDSIADVGAGKNAGTLTAAAMWNKTYSMEVMAALHPDFVFHDGADLLRFIRSLPPRAGSQPDRGG